MNNSQFEAKTFGVGELISQRKLFKVPPHQRSFAWTTEAIQEFLDDIENAYTNDVSNYFIGLIVIQYSSTGEWILLDGQQRLTTVSLIFAAIKWWLSKSGRIEDAKQIDHEYLVVRRLGGDISSRMQLNKENSELFNVLAISQLSDEDLKAKVSNILKTGSNKLLLEAGLACRKWVIQHINNNDSNENILKISNLARFLDSQVKVIAVEVSSEVDAYILFESLNDRGILLSALDLIKNYIFSLIPTKSEIWDRLAINLGNTNPEDFLKVFWTSRYGGIQKSQIFREVKSKYSDSKEASHLLEHLDEDAYILNAIKNDDHTFWENQSEELRNQIFLIRILESKQARPLLLAILRSFPDQNMKVSLVSLVLVAIVRFQIIAKGRTNTVEKVFSNVCKSIGKGEIRNEKDFMGALSDLLIPDEKFDELFLNHSESSKSKAAYLVAANTVYRSNQIHSATAIRNCLVNNKVYRFYSNETDVKDYYSRLGNFFLTPHENSEQVIEPSSKSENQMNPFEFIEDNSRFLAEFASNIWSIRSR